MQSARLAPGVIASSYQPSALASGIRRIEQPVHDAGGKTASGTTDC
jgi:hypothetical protein